jgi:hypothetical protein
MQRVEKCAYRVKNEADLGFARITSKLSGAG